MEHKALWSTISITGIWAAVAVTSIFAPDLVLGDAIRIPVGAIVSPVCGAIATSFVMSRSSRPR